MPPRPRRKNADEAGVNAELRRIIGIQWPRIRNPIDQDVVAWAKEVLDYESLTAVRQKPRLAFGRFTTFHEDNRMKVAAGGFNGSADVLRCFGAHLIYRIVFSAQMILLESDARQRLGMDIPQRPHRPAGPAFRAEAVIWATAQKEVCSAAARNWQHNGAERARYAAMRRIYSHFVRVADMEQPTAVVDTDDEVEAAGAAAAAAAVEQQRDRGWQGCCRDSFVEWILPHGVGDKR